MSKLLLLISRFCLSAWVGAAALFVVTGVAEVTSPEFDSLTKNQLAALRFPFYYKFGFSLAALGFVCGWLARKHPSLGPRRMKLFTGLMILALLIMIADYFWVFTPLQQMMGLDTKPANFQQYHKASMYLNAGSLACVLCAALLVNWAGTARKAERPDG